MHRYTHADDFLVATPVLNRGRRRGRIGYYGNTVAMRLRPQPRQASAISCYPGPRHRDRRVRPPAHVNLDRVVARLNPDRRHGAERMTRVSFGFREPDGRRLQPARRVV